MSEKGRYTRTIVMIGAPGTGKSYTEVKIIKASANPNAILYKSEVDAEEDTTKDLPIVDFYKYSGGVAIIHDENISYKRMLRACYRRFRYGTLSIDDTRSFEPNPMLSKELQLLLRKRRKLAVDFIVKYHGFDDVHSQMWKYATDLIIFHTTDDVPDVKKLRSRLKLLRERKGVIQKQYDDGKVYYHEHIRLA